MARTTWAALRTLFLQATGDTPLAQLESWDHLGEAHRLVAASLDLPELASIDESVTIASGDDSAAVSSINFDVFAILDVFNVTDGIPMFPEPGGMIGRRSYLEATTGKPTEAALTHYQRDGANLYVRGTAAATTTLRIRVQRQMPNLSSADAATSPITPQHYDRAIVHKAAELYFLLHPNENRVTEGERSWQQSSKHRDAYREMVSEVKSVRAEEARAHLGVYRLTGVRFAPRTRRR